MMDAAADKASEIRNQHTPSSVTIQRRTADGSVAKFDFRGKIRKPGISNSMIYRHQNSRKSSFATEPSAGQNSEEKSRFLEKWEIRRKMEAGYGDARMSFLAMR
jgi:hypothetical protein